MGWAGLGWGGLRSFLSRDEISKFVDLEVSTWRNPHAWNLELSSAQLSSAQYGVAWRGVAWWASYRRLYCWCGTIGGMQMAFVLYTCADMIGDSVLYSIHWRVGEWVRGACICIDLCRINIGAGGINRGGWCWSGVGGHSCSGRLDVLYI